MISAHPAYRADEHGVGSSITENSSWTTTVLLSCGVLCVALQLHLAATQGVNWDEFRFLSDVYAFQRGTLDVAVQTFHVHLFGWLTRVSNDEVTQVIVARYVMLPIEAASAGLVYATARRFAGQSSALLALLTFLSFSFVVRHGGSFRYDPMVTALSMGSLYLLISEGHERIKTIVAGALMALAGIISIKAVLYAPLLGAVALYRLADAPNRRRVALDYALAALTCLIAFIALYAWHRWMIGPAQDGGEVIAQSASKTLGSGSLFPRLAVLIASVRENPIHWMLIAVGAAAAIQSASNAPRGSRAKSWLPIAFLLPLATVAVYRNAFPYFYAFMLAPAVVLVALGVARADRQRLVPVLAVAMTATAVVQYVMIDRSVLGRQRATLDAVHEIFPAPVPFVDHGSLPTSFVPANIFMSSWGMEAYQSRGRPIMSAALAEKHAVFLIENSIWLSRALNDQPAEGGLMAEDAATLRDNFVHHWGPIWVVGKRLRLTPERTTFEILVPGEYTLEAARPVFLDGQLRHGGEAIRLEATQHYGAVSAGDASIVLRWGRNLTRPSGAFPAGPLYAPL